MVLLSCITLRGNRYRNHFFQLQYSEVLFQIIICVAHQLSLRVQLIIMVLIIEIIVVVRGELFFKLQFLHQMGITIIGFELLYWRLQYGDYVLDLRMLFLLWWGRLNGKCMRRCGWFIMVIWRLFIDSIMVDDTFFITFSCEFVEGATLTFFGFASYTKSMLCNGILINC